MADAGKFVPALEKRPILNPWLEPYMTAYNELSFDRSQGLSLGYIPWSSIVKWCELHHIYDIDDITTCIRYIRKLEATDHEISEKKVSKND